ncbi:Hypothetical protein A7982_00515 [Minicystis rosea]|nr:Hypothetical protein A7982_00515 [Minicystis rosea]
MRGASRALSFVSVLAVALVTARAEADVEADRARARAAYDRGAAAHRRGDHAAAARELALADAILPNAVTLQAALESALAADDAVLGIELSERAPRGRVDGALAALVREARARFGRRVGRVLVECPGASACVATVDGAAIEAGRPVLVGAGRRAVAVQRDGRTEQRAIEIEPGGTASVVVTGMGATPDHQPTALDAAASGPRPHAPSGPSLGWFIAALGATAAAGGVTIGFGVDTAKKHEGFVSAGCTGPVHGDCAALADAGRSAQLRTNVALGVTGALAVASVVASVITFRARGADRAALVIGGAELAALRVPLP